jgi:hypothetical protein
MATGIPYVIGISHLVLVELLSEEEPMPVGRGTR